MAQLHSSRQLLILTEKTGADSKKLRKKTESSICLGEEVLENSQAFIWILKGYNLGIRKEQKLDQPSQGLKPKLESS